MNVTQTNEIKQCPYHQGMQKMKGDLFKLNNLFLSTYNSKKQATKQTLGNLIPIIFIKGDDLVVRYNGNAKTISYVPEEYHVLKSIAHISCLIDNIFSSKANQENSAGIEDQCLETLKDLEEIFHQNSDHSLAKHAAIIPKYKDLLTTTDKLSQQDKMRALEPNLQALISDAAKCRLEALHERVTSIRNELGSEVWERVIVVNMGPQMPRKGELATQYFSAILKKEENQCPYSNGLDSLTKEFFPHQRLIYAESIFDEDKALDLVTTHICDEKLGKHVLGSKDVMHSDVLDNAARFHLQQMKV